jgi:hypothetical protein
MKTLLIFATVFNGIFAIAQNLVPNGSFELTGNILCGWSQTPTDFNNSIAEWNSPSEGTPDIFSNSVDINCWNYQPNSTYNCSPGNQVPHAGSSFAGISTHSINPNYREYLQVELSTPMTVNALYFIKFYVSLAENSNFATNNIGVGFSTESTNLTGAYEMGFTPDILFTSVITDENNWILLMDSIIPDQPYKYMIIGNFLNDTETEIVNRQGCNGDSYYFIDDVCVSIDSATCLETNVNIENSIMPERKLLRIVDSMGRNVGSIPNTLLFDIYSDGKNEKFLIVDF